MIIIGQWKGDFKGKKFKYLFLVKRESKSRGGSAAVDAETKENIRKSESQLSLQKENVKNYKEKIECDKTDGDNRNDDDDEDDDGRDNEVVDINGEEDDMRWDDDHHKDLKKEGKREGNLKKAYRFI